MNRRPVYPAFRSALAATGADSAAADSIQQGLPVIALTALRVGGVGELDRLATGSPAETLPRIYRWLETKASPARPLRTGISCGGPFDENRGLILGPPNLPGWDSAPIVDALEQRTGGRARLMNDAIGQTLALLIDLLNLDTIVLGSIFVRCEAWLRPLVEAAIAREALPQSAAVCRIVPAALGEAIGNYAAISAAPE